MAEVNNVLNLNKLSTIANSLGEFSIYTYKADFEKTEDFKRKGFFNPGANVFVTGDTIRIFQYVSRHLSKYYEFIVTDINRATKEVTVAIIREVGLDNKTIG